MIVVALTAFAAFAVVIGSARVTRQASAAFRREPGKSFLIGLAAVLITGVVGAFFLVVVIGPLLPLFVGLVGFFIAAFTLAAMIFRKVGMDLSVGSRFGFTVVGTVFLLVLQIVPILGTLVVLVLSVIGMGAFVLALFNAGPKSSDMDLVGSSMGALEDEDPRGDFIHDRGSDDADDLGGGDDRDRT